MKPSIAITLIIAGAMLVIAPPLSDYLYQLKVVELMTRSGVEMVNLAGRMSSDYRLGCWFTGSAMIFLAIGFSMRASLRESAAEELTRANLTAA